MLSGLIAFPLKVVTIPLSFMTKDPVKSKDEYLLGLESYIRVYE